MCVVEFYFHCPTLNAPALAAPESVPIMKLPLAASAADPAHKIERPRHLPPISKAGGASYEPEPTATRQPGACHE